MLFILNFIFLKVSVHRKYCFGLVRFNSCSEVDLCVVSDFSFWMLSCHEGSENMNRGIKVL
jgi:hypothetical protein